MLLCLFCPGLHVTPARLSLHEGSLDLALLHPTATQLGPINIFWTLLWLQLYLLNPLHLSFHCASFTVFCSLRSRRSPCLSTDSCTLDSLTHVVVTRRCFLPLVHETGTCSDSCTICVSPDYQHVNVHVHGHDKLRHPFALSGCSCQCAAPVCWRLLTCIRDCPFGQTFCNLCLFPECFKLQ